MLRVGRHHRRGHRLRRNSLAVVSVVGTLLSLLVFFALFGIFLTQYVPLWMTENESAWSSQVQASAAQLQSNIESQVAFGSPLVYGAPFVMTSQGIPLIAQPTQGSLAFVAATLKNSPTVGFNLTGYTGKNLPACKCIASTFPTGFVSMNLPNRYYNAQTYQLEDDAVIESQTPTNQIIVFPPLLSLVRSGTAGNLSVVFEVVQLAGNSTQSYFSGTQDIYSHYINSQAISFNNSSTNINLALTVATHYPCAWQGFFNQTVAGAGIKTTDYSIANPSGCVSTSGPLNIVTLTLTHVQGFTYLWGSVRITAGVGAP